MPSIVSLDLETTGLDSQTDRIIEIGAVRFNGRRVEDEFNMLINPGRSIPPFITQLTGISDQMVREAPPIQAATAELKDFIGDCPVLGHNVRFDLSFVRKYNIAGLNEYIDTYEMASILLPSAERYNLGSLGQLLGVPLPATHRALDDARATRGVYQILFDELLKLPLHILAEIVRLGDSVADWGGYYPFYEALRTRSKEKIGAKEARQGFFGPLFDQGRKRGTPAMKPNETIYQLDVEEVSAILEYGGPFSQHFDSYEYRPQQVEMLRAIMTAFNEGRHLMAEAGTGTGKSYAYLIPAALWAMENNTRVVISTNTINLQEQLIQKDIPELREALAIDLRATVLKGRANYLCPRRVQSLVRRGPRTAEELRVLAKVLVWLQKGGSGDRSQINLNGPVEAEAWWRLSADDDACTSENCLKHTGGNCPFYRARQSAQNAHIIIVNHALLLADVAVGGRVLPEYDYLIVDEAHHLEDATTNALSYQATQGDVDRALRELGGTKSGVLGRLLDLLEDVLSPSDFGAAAQLANRITDHAFNLENLSRDFFQTIEEFLNEQREGRPLGVYAHQERILPATRTQPAWMQVEVIWDETEKSLSALLENLGQILEGLGGLFQDDAPETLEELEETFSNLSNLYRRFTEMHNNLDGLVFKPDPNLIYWAEINPNGRRLALNAAPLHVGALMEKHLWHQKASVILTSATLTAAGDFDYMRGRLYAVDADELALGSPFDYENAALLYIANDIPEPSDRQGHQRALEHGLIQLCTATGGRTLVLFTSYDQLRRTSQAIGPVLAREKIRVYEQGEGASAASLLESFKTTERAVLLGARSFWEGVDVPGEALSVLVIVKLPFAVPSDPIVAARSETFDDPFQEYSLPEAILRFRQGFGRLIRSQQDHGIVAILDKRVLTKRYGRLFIESLPGCTARQGPLAELPRQAEKWLNL